MYVFINKQFISFTNCFVFLSRLCHGKFSETLSRFKSPYYRGQNVTPEIYFELASTTGLVSTVFNSSAKSPAEEQKWGHYFQKQTVFDRY